VPGVLKVDQIQNLAGTTSIDVTNIGSGNVLEYLSGPCDGSSVSVRSGSYTFQNVTATQTLSATYADVNGSSISYTPPEGTTRVKYIFNWAYYWPSGTQCIAHYNFYIDTSEVVRARFNTSAQYPEGRTSFEWVIAIGGSTDSNTGRQAVWTAAKNLKLQARFYGASNPVNIHGTRYWNGADSPQFSMPVLTIIAIK
jgi:hypothetical protein